MLTVLWLARAQFFLQHNTCLVVLHAADPFFLDVSEVMVIHDFALPTFLWLARAMSCCPSLACSRFAIFLYSDVQVRPLHPNFLSSSVFSHPLC